ALIVTGSGSGRSASVTSRSEWRTVTGSSGNDARAWPFGSRTQNPADRPGTGTEHNGAGTRSLVVMPMSMVPAPTSASTSVGSNLRFRWEYQPGSELFVVYTDDYDSDPPANVVPLRNRAIVVKFNRLFRL